MTIRHYNNVGKVLKFPARLNDYKDAIKFKFRLKENMDAFSLKQLLRNTAKKSFPGIYFRRIIFPRNPSLSEKLEMTVGRWLFGIPGFRGHLVISGNVICIPKETPEIVIDLLLKLKDKLEGEVIKI